jgi:hypothetical protein
MSEATDAIVLVVSEETGQLSMTKNGKILHNMSFQEIRDTINEYLNNENVDDRFEDIKEYQSQKKRKLEMIKKDI